MEARNKAGESERVYSIVSSGGDRWGANSCLLSFAPGRISVVVVSCADTNSGVGAVVVLFQISSDCRHYNHTSLVLHSSVLIERSFARRPRIFPTLEDLPELQDRRLAGGRSWKYYFIDRCLTRLVRIVKISAARGMVQAHRPLR